MPCGDQIEKQTHFLSVQAGHLISSFLGEDDGEDGVGPG